jgi:hypothetical protein
MNYLPPPRGIFSDCVLPVSRQVVSDGRELVFNGHSSLFFNKRFTKKVKINKENTTNTALTVNNAW